MVLRRLLTLYHDYSREEVHNIFAPNTPFVAQRGMWGLQGIVTIPDRPGDFVFFVTFGQQQGDHIFDEGITTEGVLSWQSQPKQTLNNPQIQQFINHDELLNSIYLFLRTKKGLKYTYLGRLKYLLHDGERENPVYFQWQILDWEMPEETRKRIGLPLHHVRDEASKITSTAKAELRETPPPTSPHRQGKTTAKFQAYKITDYSVNKAKNREFGLAGEQVVVEHEKQLLIANGRVDLADRVRHVSKIEGDGAGYDIESFTPEGEVKYIEVKTTRGPAETPFYMTSNEVAYANYHQEHYYLYRVYNYDRASNRGEVYVIRGNIEDTFELTPTQYRAVPS